MVSAERLERHRAIAAALEAISDEELVAWIAASEPLRHDGHASLTLPGDDLPLFVKLLSVTELELKPQNWPSTANCFGLPPSYGYRIGSAGFGVQARVGDTRHRQQVGRVRRARPIPR